MSDNQETFQNSEEYLKLFQTTDLLIKLQNEVSTLMGRIYFLLRKSVSEQKLTRSDYEKVEKILKVFEELELIRKLIEDLNAPQD
jgi:hypothetical protein